MLKTNQFIRLNHYFCNIPTAASGLALAIASLGLSWEHFIPLQGKAQILGASIAACIITLLLLKFIFNPHLFKQDLQHPIAGTVIPTLAMALMVISNSIALYDLQIGQVVSWLAIVLHLYFLGYFIFSRSKAFQFQQILPSWFIPPIGLVLALITHPGGLAPAFIHFIFGLGLLSYAVLLPIVLYRLLFGSVLTDNEKPIIVILATPASLLLLAYLVTTSQPNYLLLGCLFVLALSMTLYIYLVFKSLLRLSYTPAYSAFTFPLVVGAVALMKMSEFLLEKGFATHWVNITEQLANIELAIASAMVLYVTVRYLPHFFQKA